MTPETKTSAQKEAFSDPLPESCKFCKFVRAATIKGMLDCHRYPPSLTADGPLVVKDPKNMPEEISMAPGGIIMVSETNDFYRVAMQGFPLVEASDWCGEWA